MSKPKIYIDSAGNNIPSKHVKMETQLEDQLVNQITTLVKKQQKNLKITKGKILSLLDKHTLTCAERLGVTTGGAKGNAVYRDFADSQKVEVRVGDLTEYSAQIIHAKALIDEMVEEWSKDINNPLPMLFSDIWDSNNGRLDKKKLKKLVTRQINDERWERAVQIILESERVIGTKTYIRVYQKDGEENNWKNLTLDFSALEPTMPTPRSKK